MASLRGGSGGRYPLLAMKAAAYLGAVALVSGAARGAGSQAAAARPAPAASPPSAFLIVENAGQFDPAVRYQARVGDTTLWLTDTALWMTRLRWPDPPSEAQRAPSGLPRGPIGRPQDGVSLRVTFPGRRGGVLPVASDPRGARINYLLGSDPSRWRSGVRTYAAVTWPHLYPGVSVFLTERAGRPALVVDAEDQADLGALRLRVAGAHRIRIGAHGGVIADTAIGPVRLPPVLSDDGRALQPHPDGLELSFSPGPAGLQPEAPHGTALGRSPPGAGLAYSTFMGGVDDEQAQDVAVGADGSTYVTGSTYSTAFPRTPGAFDPTYNFNGDAFVSRFNPTGSDLLFSTFLGGGSEDYATSLALGPGGAAYLGGTTDSADFPTTPGAYDRSLGITDGFVTKLRTDGSSLVFSTFLGGVAGESIQGIALGDDGTAYVTGYTGSPDFPTTPGAYDRTINFNGVGLYFDAFATALNAAGTDLVYSTFLGGSYNDVGYALGVGPGGVAYVTGSAQSLDFPTTRRAFDRTFNGGNNDLFVTAVLPDGTGVLFSTYVGGNDGDTTEAIAVDPAGNVYLAGHTNSPNYPTTPGVYDRTINSDIFSDVFATKLHPTGRSLLYSTFLGGSDGEYADDLALGSDGTITMTGTTSSANFPTTPGAYDRRLGGQADVLVSRLDATAGSLLYSTFIGGTGNLQADHGRALAPAGSAIFVVVGVTDAEDFPVTPGAFDPTPNGESDAFVLALRLTPGVRGDAVAKK